MKVNIGSTYTTANCGDLKILEYTDYNHVKVEFLKTGYISVTSESNILHGWVRDKLHPSVFGIGYLGNGTSKSRDSKGKTTKAYQTWRDMLKRCYWKKSKDLYPTYAECTVCDEWLNFQNFSLWFSENYIEGFQLDKDIKSGDIKEYNKDNCTFVSPEVNKSYAKAKYYTFINPEGEVQTIYNLTSFCKENNLSRNGMTKVHKGVQKSHKGWSK